jgi:hypothetical protein
MVRDGHARFEVLSATLIRLEYADDDHFEDRPSMTAIERLFPPVPFTTTVSRHVRVIQTGALTLRYREGPGPFTPQNLLVAVPLGAGSTAAQPSWQPESNPGNLGGWRRALDTEQGPVPLHEGLLSRAGWYLLNDTQTVVLTADAPGFALRPHHAGSYQDGYFFGYGHNYAQGLADLRALTGPAPLLPRKAFGAWYSRYYAYSEQEYHSLLMQFRANGVPLDTLSVDTDWKREANRLAGALASTAVGANPLKPYSWNGWEWDRSLFPDPKRFLAWAHGLGLSVTLNVHPSIDSTDPRFAATEAHAGGLTQDNSCWGVQADPSGQCYVFDWTSPRQLDAYFALHNPLEAGGVDFWWLDWCCDGSSAQAPGLTADTWINSRYALHNRARDERWLSFARMGGSFQAGNGGGGTTGAFAEHRYTMHFTGDTCATWPMLAFEAQFTAEEGNIGLPYVTHDIGSYNGVPVAGTCGALPVSKVAGHLPEDLYVRWVQFGTFQPLDRLHSDHGDRLPWQYSPSAAAAAGAFLRLREELVPYLYTMARRSYDTGLPMVRALYLQWPDLAGAYSHPSEYTLGPDMLVAPVISPGSSARTSVWIPPGTWIDYFTGAHFTGPTTVQLEVPLQQYPVFVRSGAVIPTQPEELSTTAVGPQDPLVLTAWPGAAGSFDVYDDQGQGFSYQDGANTWTHVTATQPTPSCTSLTIAAARGRFPGAPAARSWEVRFADVAAPGAVTLGGRPLPSGPPGSPGTFSYDRASRTVAVRTPELSTKSPVTITAGPCR